MEKFNKEKLQKYGNVLHSWSFKEFEEHQRGTIWYVIFLIIILGMSIYCIVSGNYLFLVIIVMFALLEVMFKFKKPDYIDFAIYSTGILYTDYFYSWDEIKEYYIIYDTSRNMQKIFFTFKKVTDSILPIDLNRQNPIEVRQTLNKYIKENLERKYEPFSEQLSKMLKL